MQTQDEVWNSVFKVSRYPKALKYYETGDKPVPAVSRWTLHEKATQHRNNTKIFLFFRGQLRNGLSAFPAITVTRLFRDSNIPEGIRACRGQSKPNQQTIRTGK
jgi:hypothetical protein